MIGILDIGLANLRSISNAVHALGFDCEVLEDLRRSERLTRLILPGVGKFSTAAKRLRERGLDDQIREYAARERPLLGVCLGMQLLAGSGTEGGEIEGLGLVSGTVRRLPALGGLRVPHVGWNTLTIERDHPILVGFKPNRDAYFVHSYYLDTDPGGVYASTHYGVPIPAVIGASAVLGFQFHPEKSQAVGLKLLENFCGWNAAC